MSDESKTVIFSQEQVQEMARVMELRVRHGFSPAFTPFIPLMVSEFGKPAEPCIGVKELLEILANTEMALYRRETELARALDALEWYGDEENYVANMGRYSNYMPTPAEDDKGRRARNTMSKIHGK